MQQQFDNSLDKICAVIGPLKPKRSASFGTRVEVVHDFMSEHLARKNSTNVVKYEGYDDLSEGALRGIPEATHKVRSEFKMSLRAAEHLVTNWRLEKGDIPKLQGFCGKSSWGQFDGAHQGCDKNQDWTCCIPLPNYDEENAVLFGVFDGHGGNTAIDFVRSISQSNWESIGESDNPMMALEDCLKQSGINTLRPSSGFCAILCRVSNGRAKYWSIGDCSAMIWKKQGDCSELIHSSTHHSGEDPDEVYRLNNKKGCGIEPLRTMLPAPRSLEHDGPRVRYEMRNIGRFSNGRIMLCPTRAGGHAPPYKESVTGGIESIKEHEFEIKDGEQFTILMHSDGVGDLWNGADRLFAPKEQNAREIVNGALDDWSKPFWVEGACLRSKCSRGCKSINGDDHGAIPKGMPADDISAIMIKIGG